jgi:hypothetical protein
MWPPGFFEVFLNIPLKCMHKIGNGFCPARKTLEFVSGKNRLKFAPPKKNRLQFTPKLSPGEYWVVVTAFDEKI